MGMEQRLEVQNRVQTQGDFMDNSNIFQWVFFVGAILQVLAAFQKYGEKLQTAAVAMKERNENPALPNRRGPAKLPYTLLYPKSEKHGLTGMGVPNSISI